MTIHSIIDHTNENQHNQSYRLRIQQEGPQKGEIAAAQKNYRAKTYTTSCTDHTFNKNDFKKKK